MPARRTHKKSRHGCDQCRQRRVKCDERLPRCSTCIHREESCSYLRRMAIIKRVEKTHLHPLMPSSNQRPPASSAGASETPAEPCSSSAVFATSNGSSNISARLHELSLMYQWSRSTCNSFTKEVGDALRDHIIEQALQHEFLMEAILALTSLHVASMALDREVIDKHANVACHYQHKAVAGLRDAINDISPTNCDAIFTTSNMIMVCTIVSSLLQSDCDLETQSTAETMLKLTDFLHGIKSVLDVSREWIVSGPLVCMFNTELHATSSPLRLPLEDLRHANSTRKHEKTYMVYDHAIQMLEKATQGVRSAVPWIVTVQPDFIKALHDKDDLALVIFMLWGVSLDQIGGMWWAKFSGRRLVDEVSYTLSLEGSRWRSLIEWSRQQVGIR